MSKTNKLALLPVMLCFFAMGFVDLVGIASNYVKNDLQLSDSTANVFPSKPYDKIIVKGCKVKIYELKDQK